MWGSPFLGAGPSRVWAPPRRTPQELRTGMAGVPSSASRSGHLAGAETREPEGGNLHTGKPFKKQPLKCHCPRRGSISSELRQSVLHRLPPTPTSTALHAHRKSHTRGQPGSHREVVQRRGRWEDQEARVLRAGPGSARGPAPPGLGGIYHF